MMKRPYSVLLMLILTMVFTMVISGCGEMEESASLEMTTLVASEAESMEETKESIKENEKEGKEAPSTEESDDLHEELPEPEKTIVESGNQREMSPLSLSFSVESGFYQKGFDVEIKIDGVTKEEKEEIEKTREDPREYEIFYTLDGNDPDLKSKKYEGPIHISCTDQLQMFSVKAVTFSRNELGSDIVVSKQFEVTYLTALSKEAIPGISVISLTTDERNLYDYYTGIMVPGYIYDTNRYYQYGRRIGNDSMRTDEWMRLCKMTMFDPKGKIVYEDQVGLGLSGNSSVQQNIKSFNVKAKDIYFSKNKFTDVFTLTESEMRPYSFNNEYTSIVLRAGSQDMFYGNIRSAVTSKLIEESGYPGYQESKRAIVFLNGRLYGLYDMMQTFSSGNIGKRYGISDDENIEVYKHGDRQVFKNYTDISLIIDTELVTEKDQKAFEEKVDVTDFLTYAAIEILLNNTDWPDNNVVSWRYVGEDPEVIPYMDGRLRFGVHDVDLIYPSFSNSFEGASGDTFEAVMEGKYRAEASYLNTILFCEKYRDQFVTIVLNLMNGAFSSENVKKVILEKDEEVKKARNLVSSLNSEFSNTTASPYIDQMLKEAENRNSKLLSDFNKYFSYKESDLKDVSFEVSEGVSLTIGNITLFENETYENKYYQTMNLYLHATESPGYTFSYFDINGKKYDEKDLTVNKDMWDGNDKLEISVVAKKSEEQSLIISGISSHKDEDVIVVKNIGNKDINLGAFYLTDDMENPGKYVISDRVLHPFESVFFYGEKYEKYKSFDTSLNFSISPGETIYLSDGLVLIDSMTAVKNGSGEYYGKMHDSGIYGFIRFKE